METKFTPGPWLVNPFKALVEIPDVDAPICAMLWPTDLRSEDETYANAHLIAAAPELYEALEIVSGLAIIVKAGLPIPRNAPDFDEWLERSDEILSKARGEAQ